MFALFNSVFIRMAVIKQIKVESFCQHYPNTLRADSRV